MKTIEIDLEVNAAIERCRHSFGESANDILRRRLLAQEDKEQDKQQDKQQDKGRPLETSSVDLESVEEPGERITGRWTVELSGRRVATSNLKGAYRTLLLLLHDRDPNFLQAYSEERARARRFVARAPTDLYLNSPKLAKDHAKPLTAGWHFDTNLSTDQVARRARIAARLSGLRYGRDVRILNGLEEI
jgi:negative regulator of replication initiation